MLHTKREIPQNTLLDTTRKRPPQVRKPFSLGSFSGVFGVFFGSSAIGGIRMSGWYFWPILGFVVVFCSVAGSWVLNSHPPTRWNRENGHLKAPPLKIKIAICPASAGKVALQGHILTCTRDGLSIPSSAQSARPLKGGLANFQSQLFRSIGLGPDFQPKTPSPAPPSTRSNPFKRSRFRVDFGRVLTKTGRKRSKTRKATKNRAVNGAIVL